MYMIYSQSVYNYVMWKCVLLFSKKKGEFCCKLVSGSLFPIIPSCSAAEDPADLQKCRIVLGPEAHNIRASGRARSHSLSAPLGRNGPRFQKHCLQRIIAYTVSFHYS